MPIYEVGGFFCRGGEGLGVWGSYLVEKANDLKGWREGGGRKLLDYSFRMIGRRGVVQGPGS